MCDHYLIIFIRIFFLCSSSWIISFYENKKRSRIWYNSTLMNMDLMGRFWNILYHKRALVLINALVFIRSFTLLDIIDHSISFILLKKKKKTVLCNYILFLKGDVAV